jgi:hypothetical protein
MFGCAFGSLGKYTVHITAEEGLGGEKKKWIFSFPLPKMGCFFRKIFNFSKKTSPAHKLPVHAQSSLICPICR